MRKYGFRVYNPRDEKMHYDITGFEFLDSSNMSGVFIDGVFYLKEEVYIMQFTGLKDKNGKEIYEGDIVEGRVGDEDGYDVRGTITYCDEGHYFIKEKDDETMLHIVDNLEVIGNIYENADLLKGADNIE